jgi:hypothetical protein
LVAKLDWEKVQEAIQEIPGAIWRDFTGKWNHPDKAEAAEFRGKVIGYIIAEVVLAILTAGIFTEVKWVSFVLNKLGKAGEVLLSVINKAREVIGKEARAAKYAEELERLRRTREAKDKLKAIKKAIREALNSSDPNKRLEGEVASWFEDRIVDFNKRVPPETASVGEIDVELSNVIIEVTSRESQKLKQIKSLLSDNYLNPMKKKVILFAPNYGFNAEKDIIKAGAHIARTKEELNKLVRTL